MSDGSFIVSMHLDFKVYQNAKIFYQNYFCMRNSYNKFLIQLEVFIRTCRRCLVKNRIVQADMF